MDMSMKWAKNWSLESGQKIIVLHVALFYFWNFQILKPWTLVKMQHPVLSPPFLTPLIDDPVNFPVHEFLCCSSFGELTLIIYFQQHQLDDECRRKDGGCGIQIRWNGHTIGCCPLINYWWWVEGGTHIHSPAHNFMCRLCLYWFYRSAKQKACRIFKDILRAFKFSKLDRPPGHPKVIPGCVGASSVGNNQSITGGQPLKQCPTHPNTIQHKREGSLLLFPSQSRAQCVNRCATPRPAQSNSQQREGETSGLG